MTNTLAYYDTVLIAAVIKFYNTGPASGAGFIQLFMVVNNATFFNNWVQNLKHWSLNADPLSG